MSDYPGHEISRAIGYTFLGVYASAAAGAVLYGLWKFNAILMHEILHLSTTNHILPML